MRKKKTKKILIKSNKKNQELGQTKNSAKLVLFIFGIGPIIGIIIFLYSKGFFNSPNMWIVTNENLTSVINLKIIIQISLMKIL